VHSETLFPRRLASWDVAQDLERKRSMGFYRAAPGGRPNRKTAFPARKQRYDELECRSRQGAAIRERGRTPFQRMAALAVLSGKSRASTAAIVKTRRVSMRAS